MNKTYVSILIIVVIILAGVFLLKRGKVPAPGEDTTGVTTPSSGYGTGTSSPAKSTGAKSPGSSIGAVEQDHVSYTNTGFVPNVIKVKAGTVVTFENDSSLSMWPASADHPTHGKYPTTGGCIGSTFDACASIPTGGSWLFKFDVKGTWQYHDHLMPTYTGTVIVE